MKPLGIRLRYTFDDRSQSGAEVENPLFDLLAAMHRHGSIRQTAKAIGLSYRHVWGALREWEDALGQPLIEWVQGKPARLTPFAQRLLWAERQARTRLAPHLEALRAELLHVLQQAQGADFEVMEVLASHDLGLPRLQALAAQQRLHLALHFAGSAQALRSLRDGRCAMAGFHVPRLTDASPVFARALRPLLQPGTHKLIGTHQRQQGLMLARSAAPVRDVRELADARLRFVNREPGSGTRLLTDHLIAQAGLAPDTIDGYFARIEDTHVAVAATIASGAADAGVGIEAAAREFGLAFVPLVEEDYYLVCLEPALETPAVRRLRDTLASPAWAASLATMPGYRPFRPGEVLSLTKALPWWHFRSPKDRRDAAPAAGDDSAPAAPGMEPD